MLFIIDLTPGGFKKNRSSHDRNSLSTDQLNTDKLNTAQLNTEAAGHCLEGSLSLPQVSPEAFAPIHSAESIAAKYKPTTIQGTRIVTSISEMTSAIEGSAGAENHHICKVTLTGPSGPAPAFSVLNPKTWGSPPNNQIEIEMRVGSEEFPNWDHVNKCLNAIRYLVTMQDGYLNEAVTTALTQLIGARILTPETQLAN